MKARTEEYVFHRMNDLQWRMGLLEESHSITITNSEKYQRMSNLLQQGYIVVRQEDGGDFIVLGREVEVGELEPAQ